MGGLWLSIYRTFTGLAYLIRILPVVCWSVSAFAIGLGIAWGDVGVQAIRWVDFVLVVIGGVLFQGIVAHSFNEIMDGASGTDRLSQGRLSGGARVLSRGLFNQRQLYLIAIGGLLVSSGIATLLAMHRGAWVWLIFLIGSWSSLAYSVSPIRLAYRPFLGEWLCAWPATWACVYGCGLILGARPAPLLWYAATLHATMNTAWLMQHHLADIPADLAAKPTKLTTVAWVSTAFGLQTCCWVVGSYFLAAVVVSFFGRTFFPWWWICAGCSALGFWAALRTEPQSVDSITHWQLLMMALSMVNAALLAVGAALS